MRVYEAIVRGLESIGVDAAFGGAGENAAWLMVALKHSSRIKPVIVRHEQAASFMACGYAMLSKGLGVCFATASPGAFNLFSGLAVAMSDWLTKTGPVTEYLFVYCPELGRRLPRFGSRRFRPSRRGVP